MAAIFAVLEDMTARKEQLLVEIKSETNERYGDKLEWKDTLVTKFEELSDILTLEAEEKTRAVIALNSEVELLSARKKATDSHFAEKVATEVDKKLRNLAGVMMDEVKDTLTAVSCNVLALDTEQCALSSKIDILLENQTPGLISPWQPQVNKI